jgi:hypothetical protein
MASRFQEALRLRACGHETKDVVCKEGARVRVDITSSMAQTTARADQVEISVPQGLVIAGLIAVLYVPITTHKRVLDIGPIQATKEEHKTIPLPPILGGLALVGGVALLISGNKNA